MICKHYTNVHELLYMAARDTDRQIMSAHTLPWCESEYSSSFVSFVCEKWFLLPSTIFTTLHAALRLYTKVHMLFFAVLAMQSAILMAEGHLKYLGYFALNVYASRAQLRTFVHQATTMLNFVTIQTKIISKKGQTAIDLSCPWAGSAKPTHDKYTSDPKWCTNYKFACANKLFAYSTIDGAVYAIEWYIYSPAQCSLFRSQMRKQNKCQINLQRLLFANSFRLFARAIFQQFSAPSAAKYLYNTEYTHSATIQMCLLIVSLSIYMC